MQAPNTLLFDDPIIREQLLPFTYTRPVADIRIGILTIREKWEHALNVKTGSITQPYLSAKFPGKLIEQNLIINASILPEHELVKHIQSLKANEALVCENMLIAALVTQEATATDLGNFLEKCKLIEYRKPLLQIKNVWDIFTKNDEALLIDYQTLTKGKKTLKIFENNFVLNDKQIFIEEGAKINGASLNATDGPIYIGRNAEVMEGALIRGPFALCNHSTVKMGAKIYGATTIGPHSKVGGEINNSVIFGYSNKAHDGFLGNSVIGEWCNLGADTNNSNLKNNYANVKLWNYPKQSFTDTGLQFCGLFMGDHSKCGINTMFNTGTVVGVSANIFGGGFPRNFIPSFSWGGSGGLTTFQIHKAFEVVAKVMERRSLDFDKKEQIILETIFKHTSKFRIDKT